VQFIERIAQDSRKPIRSFTRTSLFSSAPKGGYHDLVFAAGLQAYPDTNLNPLSF
jgi:hypothetical protein